MDLVVSVSTLQAKIQKQVDSALSVNGISFTEFLVLYRLGEAPRGMLRRIDLAEHIGLSASGVTRLLAPMEKLGLVQKEVNPRDARVSLVQLSIAGNRLLQDALVSFQHSADSAFQRLDTAQLGQLSALIKKLD